MTAKAGDDENFFPPEENEPEILRARRAVLGPPREVLREDELELLVDVDPAQYEDDRVRVDVEPSVPMPTTVNLFAHPDAHPFVLDVGLLRKYGPEWMQWEPETLEMRIIRDFKSSLSEINFDKLQAVKCLHLVDLFWDAWTVFTPCAQALSGVPSDFRVIQGLTVPQLLIAVDTAARIRSDMTYSEELKAFMGVCHIHDGMVCPIAPLDSFLELDTEDYDVDCKTINERWPEVRASKKAPSSDTVEGEQLRRMLEAHLILEENRQQLQDQLPLLFHV